MKVNDLMTRDVRSCAPTDSLNLAAQLMWEGDFGVVPVVEADGSVVGMITDRDVCMAAYLRGRPLLQLRVREAMAEHVTTCSPGTPLDTALSLMREAHVRRIPVVDREGRLAGILSMSDVARSARRKDGTRGDRRLRTDVADTLGSLSRPRLPEGTSVLDREAPTPRLVVTAR